MTETSIKAQSPDELRLTDFENTSKVHDWRNYVGEETQKIWQTFTHEQRVAIATDADWLASGEEWE